jgi:hypothetical protein
VRWPRGFQGEDRQALAALILWVSQSSTGALRIKIEEGEARSVLVPRVSLVDADKISDEAAAAVAEVSQTVNGALRVKMHDKHAALVSLGRHLGMFDDKVKVDAVYGISDEPMSAEEWKTQAVWVGALAARLPGRRPAGARGAYLMGVAELHGRASHQDEHIRAGRIRPLAVTTAARSEVLSPHGPQLSHRPRWRSHQRRARRCRLQLQPAPAPVRGAFTRPLVDPLPRPLGRPASPNPVPQNFLHGRLISLP